jgi:hypothetical protein
MENEATVVAERTSASIKAAKKATDQEIKKFHEDEFNKHLCNCIMGDEEFIFELFSALLVANKVSCSAALNRMKKWFLSKEMLSAAIASKSTKDIYAQPGDLKFICDTVKHINTSELRNDFLIATTFGKQMLLSVIPADDVFTFSVASHRRQIQIIEDSIDSENCFPNVFLGTCRREEI